ncbi:unnamed protein product [Phaeothamnion confervicola]
MAHLVTPSALLNCVDAGSIPIELGQLVNLKVLNLFNNKLDGSLAGAIDALAPLAVLEALDLSLNRFHGHIPETISQFKEHLVELRLAKNLRVGGGWPVVMVDLLLLRVATPPWEEHPWRRWPWWLRPPRQRPPRDRSDELHTLGISSEPGEHDTLGVSSERGEDPRQRPPQDHSDQLLTLINGEHGALLVEPQYGSKLFLPAGDYGDSVPTMIEIEHLVDRAGRNAAAALERTFFRQDRILVTPILIARSSGPGGALPIAGTLTLPVVRGYCDERFLLVHTTHGAWRRCWRTMRRSEYSIHRVEDSLYIVVPGLHSLCSFAASSLASKIQTPGNLLAVLAIGQELAVEQPVAVPASTNTAIQGASNVTPSQEMTLSLMLVGAATRQLLDELLAAVEHPLHENLAAYIYRELISVAIPTFEHSSKLAASLKLVEAEHPLFKLRFPGQTVKFNAAVWITKSDQVGGTTSAMIAAITDRQRGYNMDMPVEVRGVKLCRRGYSGTRELRMEGSCSPDISLASHLVMKLLPVCGTSFSIWAAVMKKGDPLWLLVAAVVFLGSVLAAVLWPGKIFTRRIEGEIAIGRRLEVHDVPRSENSGGGAWSHLWWRYTRAAERTV